MAPDNSYNTSILLENVKSSPYAEECPTSKDVISTSTGMIYSYFRYSFVNIISLIAKNDIFVVISDISLFGIFNIMYTTHFADF